MPAIPKEQITGLVLAGGRGTRMDEADKGLQAFKGLPMALHVLQILAPQTASVLINANRNLAIYRSFGHQVLSDDIPGFAGPLAGIQIGLQHCPTPYLLCAPCDSPMLPDKLASVLADTLIKEDSEIAIAVTQESRNGISIRQVHPVFALMKISVLPNLSNYLQAGGRKMQDWHKGLKLSAVLFEDNTAFRNINTLEELRQLEN